MKNTQTFSFGLGLVEIISLPRIDVFSMRHCNTSLFGSSGALRSFWEEDFL